MHTIWTYNKDLFKFGYSIICILTGNVDGVLAHIKYLS